MTQNNNALFIDQDADLARFCQDIADSPWLALDTEFVRERTYYPQLCLIQVAAENGAIACIDTLGCKDLSPLFELLADPQITKILHAVSQDLEVFYLNGAPRITPLFDTQIAAGFLGLADQIGYAGLVKQELNIELEKGHARTDWSRRPLSDAQLVYAADDVRYLGRLFEILTTELEEAGRSAWLLQDIERMNQPENFAAQPDKAWKRLKGLGRLPAAAQHRGAKLAAWREQRAVEKNRPRRWILADAPLLELANSAPDSKAALAQIADLPAKLIEQQGDVLINLLAEAVDTDQTLVTDWERPDAEERALQKRLKACVNEVAEGLGISPSLLANRSDIEVLARDQRDVQALKGWRETVIGQPLLDCLESAS